MAGNHGQITSESIKNIDHITYLRKYGFLSKEFSTLTSESDLDISKAIYKFQHSSGITITGFMNKETQKIMNLPRCGNHDKFHNTELQKRIRRYNLVGTVWHHMKISYKVSHYSKKLTHREVDESVAKSLKFWSDVSPIIFYRVGENQKSDIDIKFATGEHGDHFPFDGKLGILAHSFQPESGKAHFDDAENWTIHRYGINIIQVMTHEFGHILGLKHSTVSGSVMNPYYDHYISNYHLANDDIQGIQAMYGTKTEVKFTTKKTTKEKMSTTVKYIPTTIKKINMTSDICKDSRFDAVTQMNNGYVYAFKGENYYILNGRNPQKRHLIRDTFSGIPSNINTVFTIKRHSFFIKNNLLYVTRNNILIKGFPIILQSIFKGLPTTTISTAFIYKKSLYFISNLRYYKITFTRGRPRRAYKTISPIKNSPIRVDALFVWQHYKIFAFSGTNYFVGKVDSNKFSEVRSISLNLLRCH